MRFGIFDHVERRNDVGQAQQYEERLQFAATADAAGFYCYHVAEHHHSPLCLAPNQAVYLAAVAPRTKRLRLSTLVYVLPLHNPIRLIEEICLIDQLSNGRFEVGVGRGTDRAQEWRMWGGDASENDARFEETLEVVLNGLQCEFLSHGGKFYNFKDLWMELRPCQQPLPPFWYAGNAAHAGERGMNFVAGERVPLAGVRELMEQYVAAFKQSRSKGFAGRDEPLYGAIKRVYVAESDNVARERARLAYASYRTHFLKPLPGGRVDPEEIPRPARIDVDTAFASGALVVGSPATIREYLQRYAAETGANYFVGSFHWGDLSHQEACRSLELFASEAMPAVP